MQHLSIRFLIGLASATDPIQPTESFTVEERAREALAILSAHYSGLSAVRGTGYWQGAPEPNLVVESIVPADREAGGSSWTESEIIGRAQSIAGEIARALGQSCVALVVSPVRFSLEGPHATEG